MNWLLKFIKNPKKIGSISPSSNALGRLMVKNLNPDAKVLELGAGSGSITAHIVAKLHNSSLLTSIESDHELAKICQQTFPGITVLNQDIQEILNSDSHFDAILSGIPFAVMEPKHRRQLFHLIYKRLSPGGTFTMFQYSTYTQKELNEIFDSLSTNFTIWNLPPAFVFNCRKQ